MKIKQGIKHVISELTKNNKTFKHLKNLTQEKIFQKHLQELLSL